MDKYGFFPELKELEANKMSMLALAHVGDSVYELLIRSRLCQLKGGSVAALHRQTVSMVKAQAQARAAEKILPLLEDAELAVYKRGRNAKVNSVPKHAELRDYHAATGFEALFGWLYLQGKLERINELFAAVIQEEEDAT